MLCRARRDEGDGVAEVLDVVAGGVEHLAVDDEPKGFGAFDVDGGGLAVEHETLHVGAVDVGAAAVVVDEGGELDERHAAEEVDFEEAVVVDGAGGAHVFATVIAAVAEGAEEHLAIEEGLAVDSHADVVAAGGEDAFDDAGGVGVAATDDGGAAHVVARFADHGIEAEVADVDAVAREVSAGESDAHDVDRMRDALDETGEVGEVGQGAVVLDVVVAAAAGEARDLRVGVADGPGDDLVEGAVAATGVEADGVRGVFGTPTVGKAGGVGRGCGDVGGVVETGMGFGVAGYLPLDVGGGVLAAGVGVDDEYVFHVSGCKDTDKNPKIRNS